MASYLRNLFGGNSSSRHRTTSSSKGRSEGSHSSSHSKSHGHSQSLSSSVLKPTVVYATSNATSTSSAPNTISSRTQRPSPLRYNTYDSTTISSKTRPMRPLELRSGSVSYQSGDTFVPYPIYTPDLSSNSRTNSNSSLYPPSTVSGHGHSFSSHQGHRPPMAPRTSSSGSVPARPALKQTNTWHAGESTSTSRSHAHVSFVNPKRKVTLHMHPLLAASQFSRAPICYDVSRPPSPQTIVDRSTRSAIPTHTLNQPATEPPTLSRLVLRSHKFPWPIVVDAGCSSQKKTVPKFYLGGSSPTSSHHHSSSHFVSCADVLHAIHVTLAHPATPEEWDALGSGSHAQRKISRAYDRRCRSLGSGWDGGIRRVDWLGDKSRLVGVEVDRDSASSVGSLVFGRS
ncbi:hypothetical protein EV361DRAFT_876245 [Lentinula raphanica]|uniref:DUF6699 domain-containing protein n=1 Tax=Lentinula raphanica TaxID=153919 RepID=A0AA38UBU9_9AGAR|nr:hypothetical protein FB446DRAFT_760867 [Lentinula raphanica]KAJ3836712.1 hypothetical protein F5878DRAFT_662746 [Lentinula raphanica]KAJ3977979.1 hypothetical protein EV361DRAFT_876245 [Lentinula raphanica]